MRHELELILKEESPEKQLRRAAELGVLETIHPSLKGNGRITERFQQARSITYPPPLGLYFSLLVYHFSQEEGENLVVRLRIPRATARVMQDTLRLKEALVSLDIPEISPSAIYRLLRSFSPTSVLACSIASDSPLISHRLQLYLNKLRYVRTSLNGTALQEMGIPPGPQLGEVLTGLHEAKLDGKVKTREEEMAMVRLWLSPGG